MLILLLLSGCTVAPGEAITEAGERGSWHSWVLQVSDEKRAKLFNIEVTPRGWAYVPGLNGTVRLESVEFATLRGDALGDLYTMPYHFGRTGVASHFDVSGDAFRLHPRGLEDVPWYAERGVLSAIHVAEGVIATVTPASDSSSVLPAMDCAWHGIEGLPEIHVCLDDSTVQAVHDKGPRWTSLALADPEGDRFDLEMSGDPGYVPVTAQNAWEQATSGLVELAVPPMGGIFRTNEDLQNLLTAFAATGPHAQYTALRPADSRDLLWAAWWTGTTMIGENLMGVSPGIRSATHGVMGGGIETPLRSYYIEDATAASWTSGDGDDLPPALVSLDQVITTYGQEMDLAGAMWFAAFENEQPLLQWMISEPCTDDGGGRYRFVDAASGALLVDGKIQIVAGGWCAYHFPQWGAAVLPTARLSPVTGAMGISMMSVAT